MKRTDPAWLLTRLAISAQKHPDPDLRALADRIEGWWWGGGTVPLDRALGLVGAPGQRSPRTRSAIERRDELLREAARTFFPDDRPSIQAQRLATALLRYSTSTWRHDRTKGTCPPHYEGKIHSHLWAILKARDYAVSERKIRDALSNSGSELPELPAKTP